MYFIIFIEDYIENPKLFCATKLKSLKLLETERPPH